MLTPHSIDLLFGARCHWRVTQCRNSQSRLECACCTTCGQRDIDLERPIWSLVGNIPKVTFEVDVQEYAVTRDATKDQAQLLWPKNRTWLKLELIVGAGYGDGRGSKSAVHEEFEPGPFSAHHIQRGIK